MINKKEFPRYFTVGFDTVVKVDYDAKTDEVFGIDSLGRPFSPSVALAEGSEVDYPAFKQSLMRPKIQTN